MPGKKKKPGEEQFEVCVCVYVINFERTYT